MSTPGIGAPTARANALTAAVDASTARITAMTAAVGVVTAGANAVTAAVNASTAGANVMTAAVKASTADVELVVRDDGTFLYVIAVRRKGTTNVVAFTGLPKTIAAGEVLHEYVQKPLPPPIVAGKQVFRTVAVVSGRFEDWFAPHDARVYRFRL